MASSIIPTAIDFLLDALSEITDLDDTQITEGWAANAAQRESIVIGGASSDQEWGNLGAQRKNEDCSIDVYIMVSQPGGTATEVRRRAYELADIVDEWLRSSTNNITLGGLCAWSIWSPTRWEPAITDSGRAGILLCELAISGAHI